MPRFPKPPEGSWTEHYPELGTEPVAYEDSISPEFYELEREAIFKRAWLNVGRVEQLPKTGSYFTKELAVANTSIIVVRDRDGDVRAFHNVCRHRGNKLVWNDFPREETAGRLPPVRVQVPRLALRPRRHASPSCSKRASSSTSTRAATAWCRSTATCGPASSSSTSRRSPSSRCASSSVRWSPRSRAIRSTG